MINRIIFSSSLVKLKREFWYNGNTSIIAAAYYKHEFWRLLK